MDASTRISPSEALLLMREQGYAYLDVRSQREFELGHPAGAANLPWQLEPGGARNPEFMASVEQRFARDAKLIIGCHTNNRSALAAAALRAAGFDQVYEQRAGMAGLRDPFGGLLEAGWQALGLPLELGPER